MPKAIDDAAHSPDHRHSGRAVHLIGQAQHLSEALARFRGVRDEGRLTRWLKKNIDRFDDPNADPLGFLFQIEIAGRLAAVGAFEDVATEEGGSDIVARFTEGSSIRERLALECKRPHSQRGVEEGLKEGAKQLVARDTPGFVVVSLDAVAQNCAGLIRAETFAEIQGRALDLVDTIVERARPSPEEVLATSAPHVVGALFVLRAPFFLEEQMKFGFTWVGKAFGSPHIPNAEKTTTQLLGLLYDQPLPGTGPNSTPAK